MSASYRFETLLPYSIRLELGKHYAATYDDLQLDFAHLERIDTPRASGAKIAPHLLLPADKYGLFFRSNVALTVSETSIRLLLAQESEELQRVFPTSVSYVAHLFGSPAAKLTGSLISVLNRLLSVYRTVYKEWHVSPVAAMDLPSWRVIQINDGREKLLTLIELPNQIAQAGSVMDQGEEEFFSQSLASGAIAAPLPTLEADIHDRVSHGDLLVGLVIMGLLVEEGLREHLIKYIQLQQGIAYDEAERRLTRPNGRAYGISELVDPHGSRPCLVESIAGWKPYQHAEYDIWNTSVRELRNEIIHRGRRNVTSKEAEDGWAACVGLLRLSYVRFVDRLGEQGIEVDPAQVALFRVRSATAGTAGLVGAFNHT